MCQKLIEHTCGHKLSTPTTRPFALKATCDCKTLLPEQNIKSKDKCPRCVKKELHPELVAEEKRAREQKIKHDNEERREVVRGGRQEWLDRQEKLAKIGREKMKKAEKEKEKVREEKKKAQREIMESKQEEEGNGGGYGRKLGGAMGKLSE